ncbi:MAG: efflux transporter outer membrane subunit [Desulfobulbus sp.]|nr:efflux transporter outer membrane subunit [Desulfobulbus sp.]
MKVFSRLMALLFGVFVTGCSLAPDYTRPELPVADQLPVGKTDTAPAGISQQYGSELGWREFFSDPQLQHLIELALTNNRDLRQSALMVEAYQAQYRIQRSALLPSIAAEGSGSRQRAMSGGGHATGTTYAVSAGITAYELDLFGRVRNLRDQALEQYLAMEENHRSVHISLVAEVARAYYTWLADRELLRVTEETLRVEEESFGLIEQREREGIATQLDLAQARTSLEAARANLALYERLVAQDSNDLSLLVGTTVPASLLESAAPLNEQQLTQHLPSSLASSILLQRPDIMAAEHELKGAHADIGAARAAFFPAIRLTAAGGFASDELSRLFDGESVTWLFSPSVSLPIFTAGRLQAQLDVAEIRKDLAVARYEKAIQTAFQETANTLVASETYVRQLAAQRANLRANQEYHELARNRYQHGLDSFLTLLDAQRSLYTARQRCLTVYLAQLLNQVGLYKALGGGWQERS